VTCTGLPFAPISGLDRSYPRVDIDCNSGKIRIRIDIGLVRVNIPSFESNIYGRWRARNDMGILHDPSARFDSLPASSTSGCGIAAIEAGVWNDTLMEAA